MKFERGTYIRGLATGFVFGIVMLGGTAFAGTAAPEIDPGMAVGGLTVLGCRHRAIDRAVSRATIAAKFADRSDKIVRRFAEGP